MNRLHLHTHHVAVIAAQAHLLVCRHTGGPWVTELDDQRVAVNTGAVGQPDHDGDPAVHYAVIEPALRRAQIRRGSYGHYDWAAQLISEGVALALAVAQQLVTDQWIWGTSQRSADLEVV